MKKILLASGCSFTEKDFKSKFHPKMNCSWPKWPEILAKKLDMDCINLAKSGAGQEYIYSSLLEEIVKTKKDKIGLVMAAWSGAPREDFEVEWGWRSIKESKNGTIEYFVNRSIRYMFSLQILCERYNLSLKQFQMLPFFENNSNNIRNLLKNLFIDKINEDDFIGWPIEPSIGGFNVTEGRNFNGQRYGQKYKCTLYNPCCPWTISEEDHHPNAEGQRVIAEFFYENIRS